MQHYKFRGKRKDNGEWIFGFYGELTDGLVTKHYILKSTLTFNPNKSLYFTDYEIDPQTLVHGSGLIIKDNEELFEGDVYRKYKNVYLVGYSQIDGFHYRLIYGDYSGWNVYDKRERSWLHMTDYDANKCELIGNIFDNPELLEYEGDE